MKKALVHFLVCVAVVVMVAMGFWQLDRLDTKKRLNQEIEDRALVPIAPVEEVVAHGDPWSVGETLQFRRVTALGEYRDSDSVLIRNRSLNGLPGYWWTLRRPPGTQRKHPMVLRSQTARLRALNGGEPIEFS